MDISDPITGYWNVVQCAVTIAIYMGFSEIYLLGVDFTGILEFINTILDRPLNSHAYDDEDLKASHQKAIDKHGFAFWLFNFYRMFLGFEKLNYVCWNILKRKLINCSAQTLIDSVPRMDLMDVLKNKQ